MNLLFPSIVPRYKFYLYDWDNQQLQFAYGFQSFHIEYFLGFISMYSLDFCLISSGVGALSFDKV